jgi:Cu/Ag efflux pump CusA
MLATIVRGSLKYPRIVTALSLLIAILGGYALLNARLDVFPDFAPPHVLVQAEAPGLDATQVESLVTRPLEGLLAGAENVEAVRSTSSQGLSAIQVVFGREGDPYRQRQVITERLADSSALLPNGVGPPLLSPLSSSMEYLLHFGFHQRSAVADRIARPDPLDHQAADSGGTREWRRRRYSAVTRASASCWSTRSSCRRPASRWTMSTTRCAAARS